MGTRVALVTKGHPFEEQPFFAVFDSFDDVTWTHHEHPEAQALFTPEAAADIDVFVLYDMPGIGFTGTDPPAEFAEPTAEYKAGLEALLAAGQPMVFMHHAIAGWPAWERYAHLVGGRFHYQPAQLGGVDYPDSGYRHDVTHTIEVLEPTHPICAGLPDRFDLTDELYLCPVLDGNAVPLMASNHEFTASNFYSADLAIRGTRYSNEGWSHPDGSNLVCWVRSEGPSPIAYVQFGDSPVTYADPMYRRVLANAIAWAASADASDWAAQR